jgi:alpha-galactosidase
LSGWKLIRQAPIQDQRGGAGMSFTLKPTARSAFQFELEINYILYPNLPLIRKWIKISNIGEEDLRIESLNVEDLQTNFYLTGAVVHHNYARMKHLGKFVGNWDDPVIVVHDMTQRRGMALGNEAMGVIKRSAFHTEYCNVEVGLTHPGQAFPFRKYLTPNQSWQSPATFVCLYDNRDDGFEVIQEEVNHFVVKHLDTRITSLPEKPVFVYNTWYPFRTHINDSLIREVARAAADCGVVEFIIDDGWSVNENGKSAEKDWGENYGDWLVDLKKFPGGLKPTFDYIKSLKMKPGLWISIASATPDAKVFREHPEWFVVNEAGKPGNLHLPWSDSNMFTASFGTDWSAYIQERIIRLVKEYGLAYAKLDLAVVTSPYVNNDNVSGSYATNHPYHRDHEESFTVLYERVLAMFDELHRQAPELFIDCTFETAGKLQLMDYAIARHAEGNWLSNFEESAPVGPLRVRQIAWWRSPALPASSLVIGNQSFDDPNFEFCLKSLIGTLPIVLGDPRKIPLSERASIKAWSIWMQQMQKAYDYMSYRRDLPGFGEPKEGAWDGWQRLNFQTKAGGIIGVFKQGALETRRTVFLKDLLPNATYSIRLAPHNKIILKAKGRELMEKGFKVKLLKKYDAQIFEVRKE